MTTFFSFAFLAASVFGKIIALLILCAVHTCMTVHRVWGKTIFRSILRKEIVYNFGWNQSGTGVDPVWILWGTGVEPGVICGDPGFRGCLAP